MIWRNKKIKHQSFQHIYNFSIYLVSRMPAQGTMMISPRLSSLQDLSSLLLVDCWVIPVISILSWICHLVFKHLDELVEEHCNECPEHWPNP
jgi:hypothetical protein